MSTAARTDAPCLPRSSGLFRRIARLLALRRSRARLADLDPHLLRDIGLTQDEAQAEARRPAWDAPLHWRR
ncbi:MAG TPA: DUF1127 domain-containing protein [Paracoccaceae bacterium]|nr:DUF1127 domain-containing protein [Paracoccaceae bacterium]HMO70925.1 DUF1127 domain-containing protein [Paracoccaceae bacterium]